MTATIKSYTSKKGIAVAVVKSGETMAEVTYALTAKIREHLETGIVGAGGKKLTLMDGDEFIKNLPFEFSGLMRAEIVN